MIETIFHFFKIHRKMIFGNPAIIVQDMFRKTPKSFPANGMYHNTVNVILAFVGERLAVIQTVMFPKPFQGIVTAEGVCIIDQPLSRMLSDMSHQFIGGYPFHHFGVDTSISLKKPKNYAFSPRASSTLSFPPAAEVCLVNLNLSLQFAGFK